MKFNTLFLYAVPLLVTLSCTVKNNGSNALKQGIKGQVTFAEGNMMPGPGTPAKSHRGVQRTVFVYAVAAAADVEGNGPLYKVVHRTLIAQFKTDSAGFFTGKLKPGRYSVLTQEEGDQLFSAVSNEKGELSPVEILPGRITTYNILVNYKAVY